LSRSRYALLGILTLGPKAGADIKRFVDDSIGHFWAESYGNLYPRLHEMEEAGLVERRTEARDDGPDAFVYSITPAGRRDFLEWMSRACREQRVRDELLLRVFFGREIPLERTSDQIERFAERQREILVTFESVRQRIDTEYAADPNRPFWLLTLRRGQLVAEARLRWAEESLAALSDEIPGEVTAPS
jgi:DNA-binding PadR family transcriptional regulator